MTEAPPRPTAHIEFTTATRQQRPARILLDGPPGADTTYAALALATSLGDRVVVIDAQRGRTSDLAATFTFDMCPPLPSYAPDALVTALAHCADQGYDTVVVAPLSTFWNGRGGVWDKVAAAAKRGASGSRSGWTEVRPAERHMQDALLSYPGHVIATMRDKLEYVAEADETGRVARRIVGLNPIGRDGMEYEWDLVATMDGPTLVVVSAPTAELSDRVEREPGARFASEVKGWLDQGEPVPPPDDLVAEALQPGLTFDELGDLMRRIRLRRAEGHPLLLDSGLGTTLGAYVEQRGNELRR